VNSWLYNIDKTLFTLINSDAAVPQLDWFFRLLRLAETWIPLYAFLLFWIFRYARRFAWFFILFSVICFAITDFTSASIIKPLAGRERPCYNPELQTVIRILVDCAGKFSMPSSHAANHFGLATFWFAAVYFMKGKKWWWLWLWAFMVGYAQIYVGKHYPFDIMVGAILGVIAGLLVAAAFKWSVKKYYGNPVAAR
jgi:membrane-associated phospholipid phosphatase